MGSTFLIAAMVALTYIVYWMIRNDHAGQITDQSGFLRMRMVKGAPSAESLKTEPAEPGHSRSKKRLHRTKMRRLQREPTPSEEADTPQAAEVARTETTSEIIHPVLRHHARISRTRRRG